MKNIITILILLTQYGCASNIYYYQNNKKVSLTPIKSLSRNISNMDYYKNSNGIVLGVTDRLLIKLKNKNYLENILKRYNLILIRKIDKNLYLLKTQDKNLTIQISNTLTKKDFIEYAHPDFIKKFYKR